MGKSEQVSIAVIVELDKYLVELRTKKTSNGALGKLACLGGGVEEKDKEIDPKNPERQAVWREVTQEETRGLALIKPENFKRKGIVRVESDRNGSPVDIEAHVYELLIPLGSGELLYGLISLELILLEAIMILALLQKQLLGRSTKYNGFINH
jgi:hypothetical protein